jgi:hypothetical protein
VGVLVVVLVELGEDVVDDVVLLDDGVLDVLEVVLDVVRHWVRATSETVLAPCARLPRSPALTEVGRLDTARLRRDAARDAAPH